MSSESNCNNNESEESSARDEAIKSVRQFTVDSLASGQSPSHLSYALVFIATEMGLSVTQGSSPVLVFQTVLQAISTAAMGREIQATESQADLNSHELVAGATFH